MASLTTAGASAPHVGLVTISRIVDLTAPIVNCRPDEAEFQGRGRIKSTRQPANYTAGYGNTSAKTPGSSGPDPDSSTQCEPATYPLWFRRLRPRWRQGQLISGDTAGGAEDASTR